MWKEPRWKVLCMYKWEGIYSQGWNWTLWPFDYPHNCLNSMTFRLYMTLCTTSESLGLPRCIPLIDNMAHSWDVDDMTHDTTRHDSAGTFVLLLECMSLCSAAGWWMSSWRVTTSPSHGKVRGAFDSRWSLDVAFACCSLLVCWKAWQAHLFAKGACLSFRPSVSTSCMFARLFVCEHIFAWSSRSEHIPSHASFICSLVNLSFCMCSIFSSHSSPCHVCYYTCRA